MDSFPSAWCLAGETRSEGGFKANKVSAISVLDYGQKQKDGKTYYEYELLSRTADGDEGGRHALISAAVNGGKLYILKIQVGDKRCGPLPLREAHNAPGPKSS